MSNRLWLPPTSKHSKLPKSTTPTPNHWHIVYAGIPRFSVGYRTQLAAMQQIYRIGMEAEPNVEWFEDGRVRVEARLHGRTGLHWIELEAAGCIKRGCEPVDEDGLKVVNPNSGPVLRIIK